MSPKKTKSAKTVRTEIVFTPENSNEEARITLYGEAAKVISDPDKLQKILELLGLPDGGTAQILHTTDDVVVR